MFETLNFESERLFTKPLAKEDAAALLQLYSDREAMKYRRSKPLENINDAYRMIAEQFIVNRPIVKRRLGLRDKESDRLIGTLLLVWDQQFSDQCEVGFSFGREHWNKGYAKETLKMVEEQLGNQEQIDVLKAWCLKKNIASVRVLEKTGFLELEQQEYPEGRLFIKKIKRKHYW